jgi:hypothetical protein
MSSRSGRRPDACASTVAATYSRASCSGWKLLRRIRLASTRANTDDDVMVVAPYNDHVDLVRASLDGEPALSAARVGTVDKFQGQEAPVVIFTMATSTGADMPRNADFLYSRNRLNVAISRARALAYVICTEDLLDTRAKSVEEMRLIGTLCSFVEHASRSTRCSLTAFRQGYVLAPSVLRRCVRTLSHGLIWNAPYSAPPNHAAMTAVSAVVLI